MHILVQKIFAPTIRDLNEKPGIEFTSDPSDPPKPGTSIGVQGEKGGGTLEGFFQLKCDLSGFKNDLNIYIP